ncbi:SDR family NAD(P)-dependent oxidoreductase [Sphingobium tyrosinilyticum]|uniref:SDR family NAD(P)-dependent oxidoreductase n=1 Tax=Sphingobium tyrosinilyticum TaxID=2715436 RepID=A0ABV9F4W5_9SPHN
MKDLSGRTAIVTGGGTGMGRELVRQLAAAGCSVATCDVSEENLAETMVLVDADRLPEAVRVTSHIADVSREADLTRFREEFQAEHGTDRLNLLFNNAAIGGGGSMFTDSREHWDRTFAVVWGGVYLSVRAFLPLLVAADEARIINMSSLNGLWGSIGPSAPHTAYVAGKFAVRGFTEALMIDLALNAPHVQASVVMPGHVGTPISANTRRYLSGGKSDELSPEKVEQIRARLAAAGRRGEALSDEHIQAEAALFARRFEEEAPTTAAQAAAEILTAVRAGEWRILVGEDAKLTDAMVRAEPERAYTPEFFARVQSKVKWMFAG